MPAKTYNRKCDTSPHTCDKLRVKGKLRTISEQGDKGKCNRRKSFELSSRIQRKQGRGKAWEKMWKWKHSHSLEKWVKQRDIQNLYSTLELKLERSASSKQWGFWTQSKAVYTSFNLGRKKNTPCSLCPSTLFSVTKVSLAHGKRSLLATEKSVWHLEHDDQWQ